MADLCESCIPYIANHSDVISTYLTASTEPFPSRQRDYPRYISRDEEINSSSITTGPPAMSRPTATPSTPATGPSAPSRPLGSSVKGSSSSKTGSSSSSAGPRRSAGVVPGKSLFVKRLGGPESSSRQESQEQHQHFVKVNHLDHPSRPSRRT